MISNSLDIHGDIHGWPCKNGSLATMVSIALSGEVNIIGNFSNTASSIDNDNIERTVGYVLYGFTSANICH